MVKFRDKCCVIVTVAVHVVLLGNTRIVEGKREHFYARQSKDLSRLASLDFELMTKLKGFRETLVNEQSSSKSLLTAAVEAYLENFNNSRTTRNTHASIPDATRTDHVEEALRNPLAMFSCIQRLCYFLHSLNSLPDPNLIADMPFLTALKDKFGKDRFPLRDDLADAADALLHIQFMYNLKAADLSQGIVYGVASTSRLQAVHCFYLGLIAYNSRNKYTLAVEWFVEAKRLVSAGDTTVDIPSINAKLVETIKNHDKFLWKLQFRDPHFYMKPIKSLESAEREVVPSVKEIQQRKFAGHGRNCSFWSMNVWSLCSGENLNTAEASSQLFCWHEFKVSMVFTIDPLRMEFLSRNPDVVQVHNAFSTAELTGISASRDSPATDANIEHRVEQKLKAITGMETTGPSASEPPKLVSYLPGGHVDTHVDYDDTDSKRGGDISTAMIYLNDVMKGGYTAFPASFATAVPSKGSAVFWFNTFSDGSPDYSTAHEECPVAWGEKIFAYKKIRFYDQFKARKCSLQPKQRFQVLVNGKAPPVPRAFAHKQIEQEEFDEQMLLSVTEEAEAVNNKVEPEIRKYAHSPASHLEALIQLDGEIYQNVRGLVSPRAVHDGKDQAESLMLGYLQDFKETGNNRILFKTNGIMDTEAVRKLAGNPLAVYRTFWRFENYIKKLLRLSEEDLGLVLRDVRNCLAMVYNESDGPLWEDLQDSMSGILNIQFVYDLKSQDIAQGIVAGIDTGIVLSAMQCMEIGSHAIFKDYYYQAIDWMETALAKVTSGYDTTMTVDQVKEQLQISKKVHDKFLAISTETDQTFYTKPVSELSNLRKVVTRKQVLYNSFKRRTEAQFAETNLAGLCQGKRHQTIQNQSRLFCWYENQVHPYFRVGPLQVELFSLHPQMEVVMYHDILGPRLLAFLRNDTERSYTTCRSKEAGGETDLKSCLLASNLFHKNDSADALRMLKMASSITGLDVMPRGIMVHASAPGGFHAAHTDSGGQEEKHGEEDENKGMATIMFYVTEPEVGGMTAFAQTGIQIPVKAGSVLFWFNNLSSGVLDAMSHHAGCPVIFGQKRIATLLVSSVGQSHLKCAMDPMRRMEVLVNGKSKYGYG